MTRTYPCPTCKKPILYSQDNPFRPFCSDRCRTLDLAKWADEKYRIASDEGPANEQAEAHLPDHPNKDDLH